MAAVTPLCYMPYYGPVHSGGRSGQKSSMKAKCQVFVCDQLTVSGEEILSVL